MRAFAALSLLGVTAPGVVAARRATNGMDSVSADSPLTSKQQLGPPPSFFTQKQDHFDPSNTHTWQQAYYVNATYWAGPGSSAPVFLCVGGEGPALDGSVVVASPHCNVAVEWLPETKGLMFAVEHRYYGCHNESACPYTASTKNPLQFLSSRQAIEDLAQFHAFATSEYNLSAVTNKWVSFGGSYPGMLAGWFRVKHPELVHAAVASSAPVVAILDMQGYNDVTAEAYAATSVGGSAACTEAIATGHATIGTMMNTTAGRESLAKSFVGVTAASLATYQGQLSFAGFGVAAFPAQSNDPTCTDAGCNIDLVCQIMTNTALGDEVARLAHLRSVQVTSGVLRLDDDADDHEGGNHKGASDDYDYWCVAAPWESGEVRVGSGCCVGRGVAGWPVGETSVAERLCRQRAGSHIASCSRQRTSNITRNFVSTCAVPSTSGSSTDDDGENYDDGDNDGDDGDDNDRWCRGYQTCTEFGFYQTCEVGSKCFYTQGLDLLDVEDSFCLSYV